MFDLYTTLLFVKTGTFFICFTTLVWPMLSPSETKQIVLSYVMVILSGSTKSQVSCSRAMSLIIYSGVFWTTWLVYNEKFMFFPPNFTTSWSWKCTSRLNCLIQDYEFHSHAWWKSPVSLRLIDFCHFMYLRWRFFLDSNWHCSKIYIVWDIAVTISASDS